MDISQIGTLFGSPTVASTPSIYNLISGSKYGTQATLLSSLALQSTSNLTSVQTGALFNLQQFVTEHVDGPEADKLIASIAALQQLMEFGSEQSGTLDPVFSLMVGNPDIIGQLPAGSLVDQLL